MPIFQSRPIRFQAFRFGVDKAPEWFAKGVACGVFIFEQQGCRITANGVLVPRGDYVVVGPSGVISGCPYESFTESFDYVEEDIPDDGSENPPKEQGTVYYPCPDCGGTGHEEDATGET